MAESVGHIIASHENVLRGSSRVPAPLTSADHDVSGKNLDQSQQTSRSGKWTINFSYKVTPLLHHPKNNFMSK